MKPAGEFHPGLYEFRVKKHYRPRVVWDLESREGIRPVLKPGTVFLAIDYTNKPDKMFDISFYNEWGCFGTMIDVPSECVEPIIVGLKRSATNTYVEKERKQKKPWDMF